VILAASFIWVAIGSLVASLVAYAIILYFLGLLVQFGFGGRSGDTFFRFSFLLPFVIAYFLSALVADLVGVGTYRLVRYRRGPSFVVTRRAFHKLVGPPPPRQIEASELRTLEQLEMITPDEFELALGDLLKEMGFRRVRRVGGSGDLGVDITARDREGKTVAVQCKKWDSSGTVGSRDLQLFIGMTQTHHLTDRAIFVTTARFTKPAADLAQMHRIELWDGNELTRLLSLHRASDGEDGDQAGFAALDKADAKLRKREGREAKQAAQEAEQQARYLYEHASQHGFYIPDAALELAREAAADRALRRRHPEHEPTDDEVDALAAEGSPRQPPKRCEDCRQRVDWNDALPGHYCFACGRAELWIADECKVLTSRPKKRTRARRWSQTP
jgi:hypothetical protein